MCVHECAWMCVFVYTDDGGARRGFISPQMESDGGGANLRQQPVRPPQSVKVIIGYQE